MVVRHGVLVAGADARRCPALLGEPLSPPPNPRKLWRTIQTLLQVSAFIALMCVGRRIPTTVVGRWPVPARVELFTCPWWHRQSGIYHGASALFNVVRHRGIFASSGDARSRIQYRAAEESLPLRVPSRCYFCRRRRNLFHSAILFEQPWRVLAVVGIVMFDKMLRRWAQYCAALPLEHTALTVARQAARIWWSFHPRRAGRGSLLRGRGT